MADQAIVDSSVSPAPKSYAVQSTQELPLHAVRAKIDGTGAGGSFLPVLRMVDGNGHVLWSAPADESIAAGGSAEVSWFPGVKRKAASSSSAGTQWAALSDTGAGINVAVGFRAGLPSAGASFYTNTPSIFSQDSVVFAGVNCAGIKMAADGHYLVQSTLVPFTHFPDGTGYATGPLNNADGDESTIYAMASQRLTPAGEAAFCVTAGTGLCQTINWWNIQTVGDGFVSAPVTYFPSGVNISGPGAISIALFCVVYFLDSDTTFID